MSITIYYKLEGEMEFFVVKIEMDDSHFSDKKVIGVSDIE